MGAVRASLTRRCLSVYVYLLVFMTVLIGAPVFVNRILFVIVFVLLFLPHWLHPLAERVAGDVPPLHSLLLLLTELVQSGEESRDDGAVLIEVRVPATEQVPEQPDELGGLGGGGDGGGDEDGDQDYKLTPVR